jgi:glycosyltransferase involved in cell wall biosynthesis
VRASRYEEGLEWGGERLIAVPAVDNVGNHLAALDCLVQVSPREGNSLTLMEAMYVGVPIVTTRVGAVEEFERAAGERLFWSVPADPTAGEIAVQVRRAISVGSQSERSRTTAMFARTRLTGQSMTARWGAALTTYSRGTTPLLADLSGS